MKREVEGEEGNGGGEMEQIQISYKRTKQYNL